MELLTSLAAEEAALSGRQGCALRWLWNLLGARQSQGALPGMPAWDDTTQAQAWAVVRGQGDLRFYARASRTAVHGPRVAWAGQPAAHVASSAQLTQGGVRRPRQGPSSSLQAAGGQAGDVTQPGELARDAPELATLQAALDAGVWVVACTTLRRSILGLPDASAASGDALANEAHVVTAGGQVAQISMDELALEKIGMARRAGIHKADLARQMHLNLSATEELLVRLQAQGCVVRNKRAPPPVMAGGSGRAGQMVSSDGDMILLASLVSKGAATATDASGQLPSPSPSPSPLPLPASPAPPLAVASASNGPATTTGPPSAPTGNDARVLDDVCRRLEAAPGMALPEMAVRKQLGFHTMSMQGQWLRIKNRLKMMGRAEFYKGEQGMAMMRRLASASPPAPSTNDSVSDLTLVRPGVDEAVPSNASASTTAADIRAGILPSIPGGHAQAAVSGALAHASTDFPSMTPNREGRVGVAQGVVVVTKPARKPPPPADSSIPDKPAPRNRHKAAKQPASRHAARTSLAARAEVASRHQPTSVATREDRPRSAPPGDEGGPAQGPVLVSQGHEGRVAVLPPPEEEAAIRAAGEAGKSSEGTKEAEVPTISLAKEAGASVGAVLQQPGVSIAMPAQAPCVPASSAPAPVAADERARPQGGESVSMHCQASHRPGHTAGEMHGPRDTDMEPAPGVAAGPLPSWQEAASCAAMPAKAATNKVMESGVQAEAEEGGTACTGAHNDQMEPDGALVPHMWSDYGDGLGGAALVGLDLPPNSFGGAALSGLDHPPVGFDGAALTGLDHPPAPSPLEPRLLKPSHPTAKKPHRRNEWGDGVGSGPTAGAVVVGFEVLPPLATSDAGLRQFVEHVPMTFKQRLEVVLEHLRDHSFLLLRAMSSSLRVRLMAGGLPLMTERLTKERMVAVAESSGKAVRIRAILQMPESTGGNKQGEAKRNNNSTRPDRQQEACVATAGRDREPGTSGLAPRPSCGLVSTNVAAAADGCALGAAAASSVSVTAGVPNGHVTGAPATGGVTASARVAGRSQRAEDKEEEWMCGVLVHHTVDLDDPALLASLSRAFRLLKPQQCSGYKQEATYQGLMDVGGVQRLVEEPLKQKKKRYEKARLVKAGLPLHRDAGAPHGAAPSKKRKHGHGQLVDRWTGEGPREPGGGERGRAGAFLPKEHAKGVHFWTRNMDRALLLVHLKWTEAYGPKAEIHWPRALARFGPFLARVPPISARRRLRKYMLSDGARQLLEQARAIVATRYRRALPRRLGRITQQAPLPPPQPQVPLPHLPQQQQQQQPSMSLSRLQLHPAQQQQRGPSDADEVLSSQEGGFSQPEAKDAGLGAGRESAQAGVVAPPAGAMGENSAGNVPHQALRTGRGQMEDDGMKGGCGGPRGPALDGIGSAAEGGDGVAGLNGFGGPGAEDGFPRPPEGGVPFESCDGGATEPTSAITAHLVASAGPLVLMPPGEGGLMGAMEHAMCDPAVTIAPNGHNGLTAQPALPGASAPWDLDADELVHVLDLVEAAVDAKWRCLPASVAHAQRAEEAPLWGNDAVSYYCHLGQMNRDELEGEEHSDFRQRKKRKRPPGVQNVMVTYARLAVAARSAAFSARVAHRAARDLVECLKKQEEEERRAADLAFICRPIPDLYPRLPAVSPASQQPASMHQRKKRPAHQQLMLGARPGRMVTDAYASGDDLGDLPSPRAHLSGRPSQPSPRTPGTGSQGAAAKRGRAGINFSVSAASTQSKDRLSRVLPLMSWCHIQASPQLRLPLEALHALGVITAVMLARARAAHAASLAPCSLSQLASQSSTSLPAVWQTSAEASTAASIRAHLASLPGAATGDPCGGQPESSAGPLAGSRSTQPITVSAHLGASAGDSSMEVDMPPPALAQGTSAQQPPPTDASNPAEVAGLAGLGQGIGAAPTGVPKRSGADIIGAALESATRSLPDAAVEAAMKMQQRRGHVLLRPSTSSPYRLTDKFWDQCAPLFYVPELFDEATECWRTLRRLWQGALPPVVSQHEQPRTFKAKLVPRHGDSSQVTAGVLMSHGRRAVCDQGVDDQQVDGAGDRRGPGVGMGGVQVAGQQGQEAQASRGIADTNGMDTMVTNNHFVADAGKGRCGGGLFHRVPPSQRGCALASVDPSHAWRFWLSSLGGDPQEPNRHGGGPHDAIAHGRLESGQGPQELNDRGHPFMRAFPCGNGGLPPSNKRGRVDPVPSGAVACLLTLASVGELRLRPVEADRVDELQEGGLLAHLADLVGVAPPKPDAAVGAACDGINVMGGGGSNVPGLDRDSVLGVSGAGVGDGSTGGLVGASVGGAVGPAPKAKRKRKMTPAEAALVTVTSKGPGEKPSAPPQDKSSASKIEGGNVGNCTGGARAESTPAAPATSIMGRNAPPHAWAGVCMDDRRRLLIPWPVTVDLRTMEAGLDEAGEDGWGWWMGRAQASSEGCTLRDERMTEEGDDDGGEREAEGGEMAGGMNGATSGQQDARVEYEDGVGSPGWRWAAQEQEGFQGSQDDLDVEGLGAGTGGGWVCQGAAVAHSGDAMERLCCAMLREGDAAAEVAELGRRIDELVSGVGLQGTGTGAELKAAPGGDVRVRAMEVEVARIGEGMRAEVGKETAGDAGGSSERVCTDAGGALAGASIGGREPPRPGHGSIEGGEATEAGSESASGMPTLEVKVPQQRQSPGKGEHGAPSPAATMGPTPCVHCRVVRVVVDTLDKAGREGMPLQAICDALAPGNASRMHGGSELLVAADSPSHTLQQPAAYDGTDAPMGGGQHRTGRAIPEIYGDGTAASVRKDGGKAGARGHVDQKTAHAGGAADSFENEVGYKAVERAVLALQAFELAVQVNGVGEPSYVSSAHAAPYLATAATPQDPIGEDSGIPHAHDTRQADKQLLGDTSAGPQAPPGWMHGHGDWRASNTPEPSTAAAPARIAASYPTLPSAADDGSGLEPAPTDHTGGSCALAAERPASAATLVVRPWNTGEGGVDDELILGLRRRVVTLLMRYPGMSQDAIFDRLPQLTSANTKQLLDTMVLDGMLQARASYQPSSAIPLMLRRHRDAHQVATKHYFVEPKALLMS